MDRTFAATQPARSSTPARAAPGALRPVKSATAASAWIVTSWKSRWSEPPRYEMDSGSRPAIREPIRSARFQSTGSGVTR